MTDNRDGQRTGLTGAQAGTPNTQGVSDDPIEHPTYQWSDGRPVIEDGTTVELDGKRYRAEVIHRMKLDDDAALTLQMPWAYTVRLHPIE